MGSRSSTNTAWFTEISNQLTFCCTRGKQQYRISVSQDVWSLKACRSRFACHFSELLCIWVRKYWNRRNFHLNAIFGLWVWFSTRCSTVRLPGPEKHRLNSSQTSKKFNLCSHRLLKDLIWSKICYHACLLWRTKKEFHGLNFSSTLLSSSIRRLFKKKFWK